MFLRSPYVNIVIIYVRKFKEISLSLPSMILGNIERISRFVIIFPSLFLSLSLCRCFTIHSVNFYGLLMIIPTNDVLKCVFLKLS